MKHVGVLEMIVNVQVMVPLPEHHTQSPCEEVQSARSNRNVITTDSYDVNHNASTYGG